MIDHLNCQWISLVVDKYLNKNMCMIVSLVHIPRSSWTMGQRDNFRQPRRSRKQVTFSPTPSRSPQSGERWVLISTIRRGVSLDLHHQERGESSSRLEAWNQSLTSSELSLQSLCCVVVRSGNTHWPSLNCRFVWLEEYWYAPWN